MSEQIALGFCNNVDLEIIWDADILADLALRHRISAGEPDARVAIHSERDLIVSILGFIEAGQGGERYVSGSDLIERFAARFEKKVTLGGTSVRAAIAMRNLGYRAALHLITQNDDVRRLLAAGLSLMFAAMRAIASIRISSCSLTRAIGCERAISTFARASPID